MPSLLNHLNSYKNATSITNRKNMMISLSLFNFQLLQKCGVL